MVSRLPDYNVKKKGQLIFPEIRSFENFGILKKIRMKCFQQDILKSILALGLKLGQLIGDDELTDLI